VQKLCGIAEFLERRDTSQVLCRVGAV